MLCPMPEYSNEESKCWSAFVCWLTEDTTYQCLVQPPPPNPPGTLALP